MMRIFTRLEKQEFKELIVPAIDFSEISVYGAESEVLTIQLKIEKDRTDYVIARLELLIKQFFVDAEYRFSYSGKDDQNSQIKDCLLFCWIR